jgi:hypothetical protein
MSLTDTLIVWGLYQKKVELNLENEMSLDDDEIEEVILNVRGKKFETTWNVLRRAQGTFFSVSLPKEEKYIDINRPNDYFVYILRYMEDGTLPSSSPLDVLLWLDEEFAFYSLKLPDAVPRKTIFEMFNNKMTRVDVAGGRRYDMSSTSLPRRTSRTGSQDFTISLEEKIYIILESEEFITRYDPVTNIFDFPPMPTTSDSLATTVGAHLYLFGYGDLQRYSTQNNVWEEMTPNHDIKDRNRICAVGTDIYVFDQIEEVYHVYDTLKDRWDVVHSSMSDDLGDGSDPTVVLDGLVYMTNVYNGSFYRFDPKTGIHTELERHHTSEDEATIIVLLYETICAIGSDGTESYDMLTDQWTCLSTNWIS